MADDVPASRSNPGRQFAFLRIFEAAGIALSPVSVVIATIAVLLLNACVQVVDSVLPPSDILIETRSLAREYRFPADLISIPTVEFVLNESPLKPWKSVIGPAVSALSPVWEKYARLNACLRLILAMAIWSIAGLILCRRSALLFVGNDETTVQRSIQYCLRRWPASAGAPLIPCAAAALIGALEAAIGLVGYLPFLGASWLFITSPFLAVAGFALAFLLLATAFGWPLMVAAVATDDCDSFGGLSRAYSSLTGRPWHVFGFAAFGALVGFAFMFVVLFVSDVALRCAMLGTSLGCGLDQALLALLPPLTLIIGQVVAGIGASFFWSATVVIYLLLRQEVDGVPVDRIAPDDGARPVRDPLPVVGIPATDAQIESNGKVPSGVDA